VLLSKKSVAKTQTPTRFSSNSKFALASYRCEFFIGQALAQTRIEYAHPGAVTTVNRQAQSGPAGSTPAPTR
jgi:hypothetical protein